MPSFWRLPAGILIACLLLIVAALLIGHVSSTPPTSILAQNSCSLPCFFGVTLGITSFDQAIQAVQRSGYPPQIGNTLISFLLTDTQQRRSSTAINFDADNRVESARLIPIDSLADIGELSDLLLVSAPSHVFRTCDQVQPVRFLLTFGAQNEIMAEVLPLASDLAPDTPLTFFELTTAGTSALYDEQSSFGCTTEIGWIGFAPLWKYLSLQPLD